MRITVTLDDDLVASVHDITGIAELSTMLNHAMERVIALDASRRRGGTMLEVRAPDDPKLPE